MHKYDSENLSSSGWGWGSCVIVSVVCVPGPTVVSQLALIQMLYLVVGSSKQGVGSLFHFRGGWLVTYMLHT